VVKLKVLFELGFRLVFYHFRFNSNPSVLSVFSNLVHMTRFWYDLHQVKVKTLERQIIKKKNKVPKKDGNVGM